MKKEDMAKLVLATLVSATGLTAPIQAEGNINSATLLAHGCGSGGGCSANKPSNNYTAGGGCGAKGSSNSSNDSGGGHSCGGRRVAISENNNSGDYYNPTNNTYQPANSNQQNPGMQPQQGGMKQNPESYYYNANQSFSDNTPVNQPNSGDEEFKKELDSQHRAVFDSLNRQGKDLAKQLSVTEPSFKDKNSAVREARRRIELNAMKPAEASKGHYR